MTDFSQITVIDIKENDDGTFSVQFDMSHELLSLFAGIGIHKVLLETAQEKLESENETNE
jgi:hypothetical protein